MKRLFFFLTLIAGIGFFSCSSNSNTQPATDSAATATTTEAAEPGAGQGGVVDETSKPDVVKVAASSPDHTTLVAALKAADLVNSLSNAGPFTVFAPTNAAFDLLPKGTVEGLLVPEKKNDLSNILEYHTYVGVLSDAILTDGQTFNMVNGKNITITVKDGKKYVNGDALITAAIPASNGMIYVIDHVLLPK
ncbi:MAG TPA: fasciclin domain-containing protein [Saprospiraceae bacterium]|nr:fasciclin domain-containing protein [Saprospiraceae bacterium]HQW56507.1 fasciclin domain-containing protein [Saprospiraceae bacterium]